MINLINRFIPWEKNQNVESRVIDLNLSFKKQHLSEFDYIKLLESIPFSINEVEYQSGETEYKCDPFDSELIEYYFSTLKPDEGSITFSDGYSLSNWQKRSIGIGYGKRIDYYSVGFTMEIDDSYEDFLKMWLPQKGFQLATFHQSDYVLWQSKERLNAYKYQGGLKFTKDRNGRKIVDISDRPGRWAKHPRFQYCGASQFWFGPGMYDLIPKEHILSYTGEMVEMKELDNDVIYVHLYEGVQDGDQPKSQKAQREFREHLGIDELVEQSRLKK